MKLENEQLNMQVNSMREEISHYKTIIEKQKSSQSNNRVEIIKEYHETNKNPFGLSEEEIEQMALKNVVQELKLKQLLGSNRVETRQAEPIKTTTYRIPEPEPIKTTTYRIPDTETNVRKRVVSVRNKEEFLY